MKSLTVVLPYYMNQGMLIEQIKIFNNYADSTKKRLELIVVDDYSPMGQRAEEILNKLKFKGYRFSLYKILTDLRWNWLQCRNLGAKMADSDWLLLTDIDHILTPERMDTLIDIELSHKSAYRFPRVNWADNSYKDPHPNSWLMTKNRYWRIGGYDETYAGHYGTDGMWRDRIIESGTAIEMLVGCPLARVDRDDIPDASTVSLDRKANRAPGALEDIRAFKEKNEIGIQTLRFPWKLVYKAGY